MPSPRRSSRPDPRCDTSWASAARDRRGRDSRPRLARVQVTEDALARITARDPVLNSFTDVLAERARKRAQAIDAARAAKQPLGPLAGVPFAVKNLFDVKGLPTRAGSKINRELPPVAARPAADRAAGSGRRRAGRRAQHGRIRLRLHRRERARRQRAQSARHDRMTGGSSSGSGGAVAGGLVPLVARLRHQRLDPRAVVVLRPVRPEADLWAAVARALVPVRREPRSSRAARALDARPRARLRRDAGARPRRPGLRRPAGRAGDAGARARHRGPAHRGRGRLFPQGHVSRGLRRGERVAAALRRQHRDRNPRGRSAPAPPPT